MHPGWADTAGVRNWMPVFRALTHPRHPDSRAGRRHHRLARRRPGGCRDDRAVLAWPPAASRHLPDRGGGRWWRSPAGTVGPRRRAGQVVAGQARV